MADVFRRNFVSLNEEEKQQIEQLKIKAEELSDSFI